MQKTITYKEQRTLELLEFAKTNPFEATNLAMASHCFLPFFEKLSTEQRQIVNPALK